MTLRYSMAAFAAVACIGLGGNDAPASTVCLRRNPWATTMGPICRAQRAAKAKCFCRARPIP